MAGVDVPTPALVTLGRDERGVVLINLELAGSVAITGSESASMIPGIVVELATQRWSEGVDVTVVGHSGELRALDRVRQARSLASVLPEARRRAQDQRALSSSRGRLSSWENRWVDGGDPWDPWIVVCFAGSAEVEVEAATELVELVGDGSDGLMAVFAGSSVVTRCTVRADGGPIELSGLRLHRSASLWPQTVSPDLIEHVDEL
ncbi:MAG: hypothetical protein ACYDB3_10550, partial [Acidimicrobiales bacterium]